MMVVVDDQKEQEQETGTPPTHCVSTTSQISRSQIWEEIHPALNPRSSFTTIPRGNTYILCKLWLMVFTLVEVS